MKTIHSLKTATLITLAIASTGFTQKEIKTQEDKGLSDLYFSTSFSYKMSQSKTTESTQNEYTLPTYYKLGYFLKGGMYVGSIFQHQIQESSEGYKSSHSWGASLGFSEAGSYINAHYLFSANTHDNTQLGSDNISDGQGYIIEFGHLYNIYECLSVGAQVAYQSTFYDNNNELEESQFIPMLSLGFNF